MYGRTRPYTSKKNALIYRMGTEGRCYFLSRPQRFGKSLLVATPKAYFEARRELFERTDMARLKGGFNALPCAARRLQPGRFLCAWSP